MKQMYKTLLATTLALTLALAFAWSNASATDTLGFDCFLIADESAIIPSVTFQYEIAQGEAADATDTKPAVKAGVGAPEIGKAKFTGAETEHTSVASGDALELAEGKKYVKTAVSINFTGVTFAEAGIYRYVITQITDENNATVDYDTQIGDNGTAGQRYLDVYVVHGEDAFEISSCVLHETTSDKSGGFVNEIVSGASPTAVYSFSFGKEVTGTQGSKTKYFQFTLSMESLSPNASYVVDVTTAAELEPQKTFSTIYSAMSNPSIITADENGSVSVYFYLKDGQYISIQGLPEGFTYKLSEAHEDYTSADGIAASDNAGNVAYQDAVENTTGVSADVKTGFTNNRDGIIPTGILLTVTPFVVGLFLFGALFFYMMARKRRRD